MMHIAVCDDNIADRKQLERLLKRESDKRKAATGLIYTDSFGHGESLRKNAKQYDLFLIDLTDEAEDGLAFALALIQGGVTAPIVLCSSKINYLTGMNALSPCPGNLLHIQKPIQTRELTALLDQALLLQEDMIPTIELRSETETYYVLEDDIVYGIAAGNYVHVFLKDGRKVVMLTDMFNFFDQISMYSHMVMINDKSMFNIVYMEKYSSFKVTLTDGTQLKSTPLATKYIKSALALYNEELKG